MIKNSVYSSEYFLRLVSSTNSVSSSYSFFPKIGEYKGKHTLPTEDFSNTEKLILYSNVFCV